MSDPYDDEYWEDEKDEIWAELLPLYLSTLAAGVEGGTNLLPPSMRVLVDIDEINKNMLGQSSNYLDGLVKGILQTTREQTEAILKEWELNGNKDVSLLDAMLASTFGEGRAEMIAITETTRAFQEGNELAWGAMGVYMNYMQWNTQRDEKVCPECGPLDGKILTTSGNERPPKHPRCRCYTSPVVTS